MYFWWSDCFVVRLVFCDTFIEYKILDWNHGLISIIVPDVFIDNQLIQMETDIHV